MKISLPKYRFLEVGISINGTSGKSEFYLVFAVPYSLCMRRAKAGDTVRSLSVEDWLTIDFPSLLAYRLNVPFNRVSCFHIRSYFHDSKSPVTICHGNSLPSSWVDPFITLIAQTYANELIQF